MVYCDFTSDYMEGAHPSILERLVQTNSMKTVGYGLDEFTETAKEKIKTACNAPDARVYLLVGGTQTNATVLSSILAPYEGVVSATTGHIATHEAGAIEATGHKVITIPEHSGKICPSELCAFFEAYYNNETREHEVMPGAVYVSHPTEYGTLYSKEELYEISRTAHRFGARLYLDGARLGYALNSPETDLFLPDIASLCDVFYIGGTKCGALFGEAVVITDSALCPHFFSVIKRHGALLAKGRMLGIQFDTLFTDDLYMKITREAVKLAVYLKTELLKRGYEMYIDSSTNQQFVIVSQEKLEQLSGKVGYTTWEKLSDGKTVIRLVTSFMTTKNQVDELISLF